MNTENIDREKIEDTLTELEAKGLLKNELRPTAYLVIEKFANNIKELTLAAVRENPSQTPRVEIMWFANEMERILKKNDYKGGWKDCTTDYLVSKLKEECKELEKASIGVDMMSLPKEERKKNSEKLIHEAADVANVAMMLADNHRIEPLVDSLTNSHECAHDDEGGEFCQTCEKIIREQCTKFVSVASVRAAVEKATPCLDEYAIRNGKRCSQISTYIHFWCYNCRSRKAIMEGLEAK